MYNRSIQSMQYQTVLGYDWEPLKNPELRSLIYDIGPKLYVDSRRFVALVNRQSSMSIVDLYSA